MTAMAATTATAGSGSDVLLKVEGLGKTFRTARGPLRAVQRVSFGLQRGRGLGVVGETGSGKSTVARLILRLYAPDTGRIAFDGVDITRLGDRALRPVRRRLQPVFQNPTSSLFPHLSVGDNILQPLLLGGRVGRTRAEERLEALAALVGLPHDLVSLYPHELSGGQQQRVAIARALAVQPELLVCDEPLSSLDVSIQAQILCLLQDLQASSDLTYLFISHNLAVVRLLCQDVAVMFLGSLVESGPSEDVYDRPLHPYTRALLRAVPSFTDEGVTALDEGAVLLGEAPSPLTPPSGCPFRTRCPHAEDVCARTLPELRELASGHSVACHLAERLA